MRQLSDWENEFYSLFGEHPSNFQANDTFHRWGDNNHLWAIGHSTRSHEGQTYIYVFFGSWRDSGGPHKWTSFSKADMSPNQHRRILQKMKDTQEQIEAEKEDRAQKVAKDCKELFFSLPAKSEVHDYMNNKGFDSNFIARVDEKNCLVVPVYKDDQFRSLQKIFFNGSSFEKKFPFGSGLKGAHTFIQRGNGLFLIVEGYATGCTIALAMPTSTVVVAFNANNLPNVVEVIEDQANQIIICADKDKSKAGEEWAQKAIVKSKKASYILPSIEAFGDFNDMHFELGLEKVSEQIKNHIETDHHWPSKDLGFSTIDDKGRVIRNYHELASYLCHKHNIKYVSSTRNLWLFNGTNYQMCNESWVKHQANLFCGEIFERERVELLKCVEDMALTDSSFEEIGEDKKICFANGVLDIETMCLLPHSKDYKFKIKIPHDWDEFATCPTWDQLLGNVFCDDQGLIRALQQFIGLILVNEGHTRFNEMLILDGNGSNGKTTIVNAIMNLVGGGNWTAVSMNNVTTNRFSISHLKHSLVNFSEEEPPSAFKDGGVIKKLTGNSPVYGDVKHKAAFEFINKARLIISYNELPEFTDQTKGFKRRLLILPCEQDFDASRHLRISNVHEKLAKESSGILTKCLGAYLDLVNAGGFNFSSKTTNRINEIMRTSNPVLDWFENNIEITQDKYDKLFRGEAYMHFKNYSGNTKIDKTSVTKELKKVLLNKGLSALCPEKDMARTRSGARDRYFIGLKFRQFNEESH